MKKIILFILIAAILFAVIKAPNSSTQVIAPSCFAKEDCIKPIQKGYCGIDYDCIAGKCYSESTKCKELCGDGIDNDYDGDVDCADNDCWNDAFCPCSEMSYTTCLIGRCWCPATKVPRWHIESSDSKFCECD